MGNVIDTGEKELAERLGADGAVALVDLARGSGDSRLREHAAEKRLAAIMEIGSAVAEGGDLDETLDQIARTAAWLVSAQAAALILREGVSVDGLLIAGSFGLSEAYLAELSVRLPLTIGNGPSGLAVSRRVPVAVADVNTDPIIEPWRKAVLREHYQALVSVPLGQREVIGVLNAYRAEPGAWTKHDLDLLGLLADHAAIAIQTARLLDESRRQVSGLSIMVGSLRAQTHEHSNRLHAIYGLLMLGDVGEAKRLIAALEEGYHSLYADVTNRIGNATIAGFLVAEASIARQSGIELTLDKRSRLAELPDHLSDLDAVTVLGNLLHNAIDAVSSMPRTRRRVQVHFSQNPQETTFRVRDWGIGAPNGDADWIFGRDCTTKDGHAGIGLSHVTGIVRCCRGRVEVTQPRAGGLVIEVVFPS